MSRMVAMRYGNLPERAVLEERFTGSYEGRRIVVERWSTPDRWADAGTEYLRFDNGLARWARSYRGKRAAAAAREFRGIVRDLRGEPGFVPDDSSLLIAG